MKVHTFIVLSASIIYLFASIILSWGVHTLKASRKVQLNVRIPLELDQKLRKEIARRYGEYKHGMLTRVIIEAIELWLEEGAHTHTNNSLSKNNNDDLEKVLQPKPPRSAAKVMAIVMALRGYDEVTEDDIREIIAQVAGYDPRTIRKYVSILSDIYKVIRKERITWNGRKRVVVYSVNNKLVELLLNEYSLPLEEENEPKRLWM